MKKSYLDGKYRLMAPGPVQISPKVLAALSEPMIHHRTPQFESVLKKALAHLKLFFQTQNSVLIIPGTGTAGMEAAVVNCFSPGDEILVIVSGKFGERWAEIAEAYGIRVETIDVEWGKAVAVDLVEKRLNENPHLKGVLTQACETSTATWQPVKELANLVKTRPQTLFLVDGITAVGCEHLPMDDWSIDVIVAGSQKAFSLPTGLAFVAMSEKAWGFNAQAKCPRYYFNLAKEKKANENGQTQFSSVVNLIQGLNVFLEQVDEIGLEHLIRRTRNLAIATQKAASLLGLQIFSKNPSPSVTAIAVPSPINGGELRLMMEKDFNITVMGGQDQLKGKIIRIGHMGDISNQDLLATIEALGKSLQKMGHPLSDETLESVLEKTDEFLKICSNV